MGERLPRTARDHAADSVQVTGTASVDHAAGRQASMRPRHSCRGRQRDRRIPRRLGEPASMRPRHFWGGRPVDPGRASSPSQCFNEAPAFPPGKIAALSAEPELRLQASMWPRHCCRGKSPSRRSDHPWRSSCFKGALGIHTGEDDAAGAVRGRRTGASTRSRHPSPGRQSHQRLLAGAVLPASMRPRHSCQGRRRVCAAADARGVRASMWPATILRG
jgi:hypothetical protein